MKPYIVCANGRTGTALFAHILKSHDLGYPSPIDLENKPIKNEIDLYLPTLRDSYNAPVWSRTIGCHAMPKFIEICRRFNGLSRRHSHKQILELTFPNIRFIYISRLDTLRQAISVIKARQSGCWGITNITETPDFSDYVYDYDQITAAIERIEYIKNIWREWFRLTNIDPLQITYEDLCQSPLRVIALCAKLLCVDNITISRDLLNDGLAKKSAPVKQADSLSEEWATRYERQRSTK